jgi:hypothetical protein
MTGERITVDDVRLAGYCSVGAKKWFRAYSLDFKDFLKNGIETDKFLATGDAIAEHIVRSKRERRLGKEK